MFKDLFIIKCTNPWVFQKTDASVQTQRFISSILNDWANNKKKMNFDLLFNAVGIGRSLCPSSLFIYMHDHAYYGSVVVEIYIDIL